MTSGATAAYYAYLAHVDRERARVLRAFGYIASADHIDRRAVRYERKSKGAEEPTPTESDDDQ